MAFVEDVKIHKVLLRKVEGGIHSEMEALASPVTALVEGHAVITVAVATTVTAIFMDLLRRELPRSQAVS